MAGYSYGFEFKYADTPGKSRSIEAAIHDLALKHLWVVYPGRQEYVLNEEISVIPLDRTPRIADSLKKNNNTTNEDQVLL